MKRIEFYVPGKPEPQPKYTRRFGGYGVRKRDKDGSKARWAENVFLHARMALTEPFSGAVRLGVEIRVDQPKSNKKKYPAQVPDWSNYWYYVENILKGLAYADDCQVIGPLPGDKLWSTPERPQGAYVTIEAVA